MVIVVEWMSLCYRVIVLSTIRINRRRINTVHDTLSKLTADIEQKQTRAESRYDWVPAFRYLPDLQAPQVKLAVLADCCELVVPSIILEPLLRIYTTPY